MRSKIVRKKALLFILLVALVSLTATLFNSKDYNRDVNLAFKQASLPCYTVQHAMGETCVPLNPKRILTLNSFALGDVLALSDVKPIASMVSTWEEDLSYLKQRKAGIQLIRSLEGQVSVEKVLLLKPDLIVGLSEYPQSVYQQLSKIAPTIIVPWKEISFDWKQRFKEVAVMLNKTEVANQHMANYQNKVEELKEKLRDRHSQIKASILYIDIPYQFHIGLKDSFAGSILDDAGLLSSQKLTTGPFQTISEEILPKLDSEVFFVINLDTDKEHQLELKQRPLWATLKAVQRNQVYLVDNAIWHGYNIFAAHAVLDDLFKYLVSTP